MRKLSDETYEYNAADYRRTIWYLSEEDKTIDSVFGEPDEYGGRKIVPCDYTALAHKLHALIENDIQSVSTDEVSETHWIFYSGIINGDAIEDDVRFSIFVRLKNDRYECNNQYPAALKSLIYSDPEPK